MVTLECATCGTENDFPSVLTVVEEPIDGWELDVTVEDTKLIVNNAYCPDCQ